MSFPNVNHGHIIAVDVSRSAASVSGPG
jgi:hypothetical protein